MATTPPARPRRRILRSVFTKLLIVTLITGLGITILVIGYFIAYRHLAGNTMGGNWNGFVRYLVKELGSPPSLDRARTMAQELSVQIYYRGPEIQWSTSTVPLPPNLDRFRVWHRGPGYRFGSLRGHPLLIVTQGNEQIIFDTRNKIIDHSREKRLTLFFLLLLLLLLAGAYGLIRWLLRPLRPLHEGVQRVSQGDLDHRIRLRGKDEFQDLAEAFNTMTQEIGKLLKLKERLLLDVSHELRSPLTRMKVALEMLPDSAKKEGLQEDLREMERMVTEILDTYRSLNNSTNLNLENVELRALIQETAALLGDRSPGIAPQPPNPVSVSGDPGKLKTLFTNLLDNALKYSRPDAEPVEIDLHGETDMAVIQIRDHGQGIPKEALPHVFEPFYRVDISRTRGTGGFGLGLSLCKAIVKAHGGTIAIESELGKGTQVIVKLPRVSN